MNFGIVVLALMLVGGSILGIFAIAAGNQVPYTDTLGTTTTPLTNQSHMIVENGTAPAMGAGGGIAILLAVLLIFVAVVFLVRSVSKQNSSSYSYHQR